ncbi:MAG TPA: OmpH family outer membrane protein [Candidatus Binatia bacterium]|jgi:outer membrane protein|nr:OmpH family outer membrane protein [Candidatus Binatia bacterium]
MRQMHKRSATWTAVGVVTGVLVLAVAARAETKVAVVDMQRVLNECDAGKKAKEQIRAKLEGSQAQLKRQQEELQRKKEEYEKKASVLKEEDRHKLERDLESENLSFKRKLEDFERDAKRTDAELTQSILEEIYSIVRDYGEKHGYTMVLEASSGGILYADKAVDISDEIVKLHNSSPRRSTSKGKD